MNEPRKELRRWRAWACWALACKVRPELEGDPKHRVAEPDLEEIAQRLGEEGSKVERDQWRTVFKVFEPVSPRD
jgi:hypothetical protein